MPRRTLTIVAATLLVCVALPLWLLLAPRGLGGSTSYVVIAGDSMEPGLHAGDLVLAKERDSYDVGDAVVYRNLELDRWVLHRIVATDREHFVLKGDHNDYVDGYRPTEDEIVGEQWARLPGAGSAVAWMRRPLNAALLLGVAVLLVALGGGAVRRAERRGSRSARPLRLPPMSAPWRAAAFAALGALGVSSLVLLVLAATAASGRVVEIADAYEQRGVFSYRANVPAGPVYQRGRVETGQPVFVEVVDHLAVGFDYVLAGAGLADVHGTGRLWARLSDGAGWVRAFPLAPEQAFSGPTFSARGTLDLRELEAAVGRFERETGATSSSYLVTIAPRVEVEGTLGNGAVADTFRPELVLRMDDARLAIELGEEETLASTLAPTQAGAGDQIEPATVSGLGIGVPLGRALGALGLALALIGIAAIRFSSPRRSTPAPHERIASRYGGLLVRASGVAESGKVVRVETIGALAALADRYGRAILHEQRGRAHLYAVEEDGIAYLFELVSPQGADRGGGEPERTVPVHLLAVPTLPRLEREATLGAPREPAGSGDPVAQ